MCEKILSRRPFDFLLLSPLAPLETEVGVHSVHILNTLNTVAIVTISLRFQLGLVHSFITRTDILPFSELYSNMIWIWRHCDKVHAYNLLVFNGPKWAIFFNPNTKTDFYSNYTVGCKAEESVTPGLAELDLSKVCFFHLCKIHWCINPINNQLWILCP